MTELETLERARSYMAQLANGIDPITGREIPEDSVVNHVRISRCFFYVEDVLRRLVEQGGLEGKRSSGGQELFYLTQEQKERLPYFDQPVGIMDFVRMLNDQVDQQRVKKISAPVITRYLQESGFLEECLQADGRKSRLPTEAGYGIGLSVRTRQGERGEYAQVLYDLEAQHFLVDNLDAILLAWQERKNRK